MRYPLRISVTVIGLILTIIGLAGVPDDLLTWAAWLSWVGGNAGRWALVMTGFALMFSSQLSLRSIDYFKASLEALLPRRQRLPRARYYRDHKIRFCELASEDGTIDGVTFESCHIVGPSVATLHGKTTLIDCSAAPYGRKIFWPVDDRQHCVGAVVIKDCVFRWCQFDDVGFAGSVEQIEKWELEHNFDGPPHPPPPPRYSKPRKPIP